MTVRNRVAAIAAATLVIACVTLPLASVQAQSIQLGPNGLRVDPPEVIPEEPQRPLRRLEPESISEFEAVRIARSEGLNEVERVRQGRRGWVIAGTDRNGDDIRVIIGRDGDVIDVQRE